MSGNVQANSNYSPSFIKAKTPEELEKLMLMANLKDGKVYHFRDISFSQGYWIAWYDSDHSNKILIKRLTVSRMMIT